MEYIGSLRSHGPRKQTRRGSMPRVGSPEHMRSLEVVVVVVAGAPRRIHGAYNVAGAPWRRRSRWGRLGPLATAIAWAGSHGANGGSGPDRN